MGARSPPSRRSQTTLQLLYTDHLHSRVLAKLEADQRRGWTTTGLALLDAIPLSIGASIDDGLEELAAEVAMGGRDCDPPAVLLARADSRMVIVAFLVFAGRIGATYPTSPPSSERWRSPARARAPRSHQLLSNPAAARRASCAFVHRPQQLFTVRCNPAVLTSLIFGLLVRVGRDQRVAGLPVGAQGAASLSLLLVAPAWASLRVPLDQDLPPDCVAGHAQCVGYRFPSTIRPRGRGYDTSRGRRAPWQQARQSRAPCC
jgi:hypothetical protein